MENENEVSFLADLQAFFKSQDIETPEGIFQVFQSMTYGEMLISCLLLILILCFVFKWIWEVLR